MTLDVITSPLLNGIKHGFFGRAGGASSGVFSGLNCGYGSSDQHEIVSINRERVAGAMDVAPEMLAGVHQIHSGDAVTLTEPISPAPKVDGMVTATPGLALGILTADCQPVLFADQKAGVIGAAHAGWKGALGGVLDVTVSQMEALGASRDNIVAVSGPTISQKAYEVGPEFRETFLSADPDFGRFFLKGAGDRFQFDLPAFGLDRLAATGIQTASWTGHCTYSDPERFFSYRRSVHRKETDYGRLISAICL